MVSIIWVWGVVWYWTVIWNVLTYSRIIYSLRQVIRRRRINILHRAMHILIWPTRVSNLPITITKWRRIKRNTRTDHITVIKVATLCNSFLALLWSFHLLLRLVINIPTRLATHNCRAFSSLICHRVSHDWQVSTYLKRYFSISDWVNCLFW